MAKQVSEAFVKAFDFWKKKYEEYYKSFHPDSAHLHRSLAYKANPKNIKVITVNHEGENESVWCFVDYEGNIYKAASWSIPARHVRGRIDDPDHSWGQGLSWYGAAYLK